MGPEKKCSMCGENDGELIVSGENVGELIGNGENVGELIGNDENVGEFIVRCENVGEWCKHFRIWMNKLWYDHELIFNSYNE